LADISNSEVVELSSITGPCAAAIPAQTNKTTEETANLSELVKVIEKVSFLKIYFLFMVKNAASERSNPVTVLARAVPSYLELLNFIVTRKNPDVHWAKLKKINF